MKLTFEQKTALEQIRAIEEHCAPLKTVHARTGRFDQYLGERLQQLLQAPELARQLARPQKLYRLLLSLLLIISALAGAAATFKAVAGPEQTLNVFWILVVLLGFHCVSFILWLLLAIVAPGKKAGPLGNLFSDSLQALLGKLHKDCAAQKADAGWLSMRFGPPLGRWQLGLLTHSAWLVYLAAGLVALLLILATRQYDFIWGSTLLSDQAYATLTGWLAAPMHALGWPVVTAEQVRISQLGESSAHLAGAREGWAWFLLGCLLLYGLLPRLLAWGACFALRTLAARRWALDTHLPYYLQLQLVWQPPFSQAKVLDADAHPPGRNSVSAQQLQAHLPEGSLMIGLELGNMADTEFEVDINVVDKHSEQQALQLLQQSAKPVVLITQSHKSPDRGVLRLANTLLAQRPPAERWLAVVQTNATNQYEQWLGASAQLAVIPQQCILLSPTGATS